MSFGSPYVTLPRFSYLRPRSLDEAFEALEGGNAKVMAGGIGLLNFMKERLLAPSVVIDIKGIPELSGIRLSGDVRIGAAVRLVELEENRSLELIAPTLYRAVRQIADPIIRSSATLVGDVCEAIPWTDGPTALAALDASASVVSKNGERKVKVADLVQGLGQLAIDENEIVKEITFSSGYKKGTYVKFSNASEYALASVAVAYSPESGIARVSVGSLAEKPQVFTLEDAGTSPDEEVSAMIRKVSSYIESGLSAVDDILGSAEFKKQVAKALIIKAFKEVF